VLVLLGWMLAACGGADPPPVVGNGTAELQWAAPTRNADGSPLKRIDGFNIYLGTTPAEFYRAAQIPDPTATTYAFHHLAPGTYYFSVAAYGPNGEGRRTPPVSKTIH